MQEVNSLILLPFDVILRVGVGHSRDILHDDFRSFGFSRAGLAANHNASVRVLLGSAVRRVGHSVDVWGVLKKLSSFVFVDELISVNVHSTIRIDRDGNFANVGINFSCLVSVIKSKRNY